MDKLDLILDELRSFKSQVNEKFNSIGEKIYSRFDGFEKKLSGIEDQVFKNTETLEELKCSINKQEVEIRVIKGGNSKRNEKSI